MIISLLDYFDIGLLLLRFTVGAIFIIHAVPKFKDKEWMPLAIVEALGGIAVALGIFTQLAALGLSIIMVGAIYMKSRKWGIPFTTQSSTGWEFDLLILVANIVIVTTGGGTLVLFS